MERKKILWLASWYPNSHSPFDGDFIQRHAKAAALYNDVHVIHVVTPVRGSRLDRFKEELNQSGWLSEHVIYPGNRTPFQSAIFRQLLWSVHFKKAIKKYISEKGLPDLVHVQVPMKAGIIGLWMKRKFNIKYLVSEHWGIYNTLVTDSFCYRSFFFQTVTKRIIKKASALLTVSKYLGQGLQQWVLNRPFIIVPNVVNTEIFQYRPLQNNDVFRFLHISNLQPVKNPLILLKAIKKVLEVRNNVEFFFVGNEDAEWENYASSMALPSEKVKFKGVVPYEQVAIEMNHAHAFFLSSTTETFSCSTAEALCCGLPVIAANTGALPELVNDQNGTLVEKIDENALAESMLGLVDTYVHYDRKKISDKARERFSYPIVGSKLDDVYNSVLQGDAKPAD